MELKTLIKITLTFSACVMGVSLLLVHEFAVGFLSPRALGIALLLLGIAGGFIFMLMIAKARRRSAVQPEDFGDEVRKRRLADQAGENSNRHPRFRSSQWIANPAKWPYVATARGHHHEPSHNSCDSTDGDTAAAESEGRDPTSFVVDVTSPLHSQPSRSCPEGEAPGRGPCNCLITTVTVRTVLAFRAL
jgi:hypothetical protein